MQAAANTNFVQRSKSVNRGFAHPVQAMTGQRQFDRPKPSFIRSYSPCFGWTNTLHERNPLRRIGNGTEDI